MGGLPLLGIPLSSLRRPYPCYRGRILGLADVSMLGSEMIGERPFIGRSSAVGRCVGDDLLRDRQRLLRLAVRYLQFGEHQL